METVQPANKSAAESRCVILCVRISIHARSRRTNLFSIPICAQFRPVQRPCYLAAARELGAHTPGKEMVLSLFLSPLFFLPSIFSQPPTAGGYIGIHLSLARISSYGAHRRGRSLTISIGAHRGIVWPPCVIKGWVYKRPRKIPRERRASKRLPPWGVYFFSALGTAHSVLCTCLIFLSDHQHAIDIKMQLLLGRDAEGQAAHSFQGARH